MGYKVVIWQTLTANTASWKSYQEAVSNFIVRSSIMILSQVGIFQGSLPSHPSVYRSTAFSTLSAPLKNLLESQTHLNQIHSVLLRKLRKGDIRYTFQG